MSYCCDVVTVGHCYYMEKNIWKKKGGNRGIYSPHTKIKYFLTVYKRWHLPCLFIEAIQKERR